MSERRDALRARILECARRVSKGDRPQESQNKKAQAKANARRENDKSSACGERQFPRIPANSSKQGKVDSKPKEHVLPLAARGAARASTEGPQESQNENAPAKAKARRENEKSSACGELQFSRILAKSPKKGKVDPKPKERVLHRAACGARASTDVPQESQNENAQAKAKASHQNEKRTQIHAKAPKKG